jgi:hypothetical protein
MRHEPYGRRTNDVAVCVPGLGGHMKQALGHHAHFQEEPTSRRGESVNILNK